MRIFVESLKRLYEIKQIDNETIEKLHSLKKITEEEVVFILGKDGDE